MPITAPTPEEAAERILTLADCEMTMLPEKQQAEALRRVMQEMGTWLQAIAAGNQRRRKGPRQ